MNNKTQTTKETTTNLISEAEVDAEFLKAPQFPRELTKRLMESAAKVRVQLEAALEEEKRVEEYCMSGKVKVWIPKRKW